MMKKKRQVMPRDKTISVWKIFEPVFRSK